jgi:hypothetical protein
VQRRRFYGQTRAEKVSRQAAQEFPRRVTEAGIPLVDDPKESVYLIRRFSCFAN